MKTLNKQLMKVAAGVMMAGLVQAGDMDSVVAYSLGEFDRVGINHPAPRIQQSEPAKVQKTSAVGGAQSRQDKQLAAQKAEFLRRMFWLALVSR